MKSEDSPITRPGARALVTILLGLGLASCAVADGAGPVAATQDNREIGPQADYPILVGEPYEIAGTHYTPADVLNYDEVGYVTLDANTAGFTGSHHTLPVPSYAEVTSLESGRTILVRLERRGPMTTNHLLALSPAAISQLGAGVETPVRVRRVNPPEVQRAMLRAGEAAPQRMDTPSSLLTVLRRRLPDDGSASLASSAASGEELETVELAASTATQEPDAIAQVEAPALDAAEVPSPRTNEDSPPADTAAQALDAGFVVQAATFANSENASRAASVLGGEISRVGEYYRVRTGPFATRGEAEASLANVRSAGYSDARILTSG